MSVLHRAALEASPLADLHAIASELGIDGFRRLRKADLDRPHPRATRAATADGDADDDADGDASAARRRAPPRRRRGRRAPTSADEDADAEADARPRRRRGTPRRPRPLGPRRAPSRDARRRRRARPTTAPSAASETSRASSSCSATARASCASSPPEPSDDDVYISAAQVRRCELVSGDRVGGPGAHAAALGALPVARARRHDQRRAGRGGRRGHAATTSCRARSRPSASSSAPTTRR